MKQIEVVGADRKKKTKIFDNIGDSLNQTFWRILFSTGKTELPVTVGNTCHYCLVS